MTATPPQTLGRYHVLGELATGGMAEILLARIEGPSGFTRPVVIKRILPHFARQPSFVTMFLDEGRIVAGIRHPNVVQVHELSTHDSELFLVMEYLEGETTSGLMKRLLATKEELELRLAAYVVAEVCAGLHAAHELEDDRGVKQSLVHRDVSPQNIIVTYDGHVKLLDFGVALVADRVTRTEVGNLKGKLQYMSPEQCAGQPLDRRSDIFALGIVLYELTTGRLLFKRESSAATIRAICDEPILPPSRLVPDYPPALEAICLRALAQSPEDRFSTCADMRAALLDGLRASAHDGDVASALSTVMRRIFADRVTEKRELLRRVKVGEGVSAVPAGEVDRDVELRTVQGSRSRSSMRKAAPRRKLVLAALLAASIAAGGAWWRAQQVPTKVAAPVVLAAPAVSPSPPALPTPELPAQTPPALPEATPHTRGIKKRPARAAPPHRHDDNTEFRRFD